MRAVVVGATGNVGTSVVEALSADPEIASVLGVARRIPAWTVPRTEWARADVTETDLTAVFRGADAVLHLGWIFQPTHDPALTWRNNVVGSIRVFRAVAAAQVPILLYASSVGAYSPAPQDRDVDENWPTDGWPQAAYSREKAYLERILDTFEHEHPQCRVVRFRPGFIFKREASVGQRRLFGGPLVPGRLADPALVPVLPALPGLRFQALHSADVAEAFRLAIHQPVHGPFNLAASPIIDVEVLAEFLNARPVRMHAGLLRAALSLAWHLHVLPASPDLFDAVLRFPTMATNKARNELGWAPRRTSTEALSELLAGLRNPTGGPTPPLAPGTSGPLRIKEFITGIGQKP